MDSINMNKPCGEFRFLMIIAGLILTFHICSGILGPVVIFFGTAQHHFSVTCGIIPFCLSFFLMDIFTNQYGYEYAKKLGIGIAICSLVMSLTVYFLMKIPTSYLAHDSLNYENSIDKVVNTFFACGMSVLAAFYANSFLFYKLFFYFQGRHLWLRCLVATSLGELIYSSVFAGISFYHTLSLSQITTIILGNYLFKFIFELVTLPFTYILVYLLATYENKSTNKYNTFNLGYFGKVNEKLQ